MMTEKSSLKSGCHKVRVRGKQVWYCCCGKVRPGFPGAGKVRCHCAPMVGKGHVDVRGEVCFEAGPGGKTHRVRCPKRRR